MAETIEFLPNDAQDDLPENFVLLRTLKSSESGAVLLVEQRPGVRAILKLYGSDVQYADPDADDSPRPWFRERQVLERLGDVDLPGRPSPFPKLLQTGSCGPRPANLIEEIDGQRLDGWYSALRHAGRSEATLKRFDRVMASIAEALCALIDQRVVHGDLKARNVLVDASDNAYLVDFDISKIEKAGLTTVGRLEYPDGTPTDHPLQRGGSVDSRDLLNEILYVEDTFCMGRMVRDLIGDDPQKSPLDIARFERWTAFATDTSRFSRISKWGPDDLARRVESITSGRNAVDLASANPRLEAVNLSTGPVPLHPHVERAIDTTMFARLRQLRQLSLVRHIHAGAEHTRWEHLLHTYQLTRGFTSTLVEDALFRLYMDHSSQSELLGTALFHDLNHFPFMHYLQECLPKHIDDAWTLDRLFEAAGEEPAEVLGQFGLTRDRFVMLAYGSHQKQPDAAAQIINSLVSSAVDVDKVSYLLLDSLHSGVRFGQSIEPETLMRLAAVDWTDDDRLHVTYDERAIPAIDSLLTARSAMFQAAYWHRINRAIMAMVIRDYLRVADAEGDLTRFTSDYLTGTLPGGEYSALDWLSRRRADADGAPSVVEGLSVNRRHIYKRFLTIKPEHDDDSKSLVASLVRSLEHRDGLDQLAAHVTLLAEVRAVLGDLLNMPVGEDDVLLDAPRRQVDLLNRPKPEQVYLRTSAGVRRYSEVVGTSKLPGDANLLRIRQHVRLFIHPAFYSDLRASWRSDSDGRLRSALARATGAEGAGLG